jgi:two-component system alkaline phosphatase synthesis response regulator PhoP
MAKKILLVDDDLDFLEATKRMVESSGFGTDTAVNAEEGLEKAKKGKPDLIVLDVMMPGMDGWEACEVLKNTAETRDIPIIMLTAVASNVKETTYSHQSGKQTEADDYIPKPVEIEDLLKRIKRLLK